jgi:hypothetical protein
MKVYLENHSISFIIASINKIKKVRLLKLENVTTNVFDKFYTVLLIKKVSKEINATVRYILRGKNT